MIEIYDEEGYIKEVIEHGLSSDRWMRDLTLLVRYWKGEGKEVYISKKRVKNVQYSYLYKNKNFNFVKLIVN